MEFIDVNCMLGEWAYKDLRFKTAEGLAAEMERLGISKAMVFSSRAWLCDIKTGNETIIKETKGYESLIPVAVLTPLVDREFGGRKALEDFLKENGIGAVRLFPMDQNFTLNLWNVDKLFSILDEMNMTVLLEGRGLYGTIEPFYPQIFEMAKNFKNINIVLLSVGYRSLRILYELFDRCPNISIDTSTFITFRGIEDVVRNFGPERLLFGSRMPFIEAAVSVGRLIYADINRKDKESIARGNLLRMLGSRKL